LLFQLAGASEEVRRDGVEGCRIQCPEAIAVGSFVEVGLVYTEGKSVGRNFRSNLNSA
jgi:hypothetical protein